MNSARQFISSFECIKCKDTWMRLETGYYTQKKG